MYVKQTFEVWPQTVVIILEKAVQQQGHVVNCLLSVQPRLKKVKGEVHQDCCCCPAAGTRCKPRALRIAPSKEN
jgi:hypothetical protein